MDMDMDMAYYGTGESGRYYAKAQNYAELFRKIPSRVYTVLDLVSQLRDIVLMSVYWIWQTTGGEIWMRGI